MLQVTDIKVDGYERVVRGVDVEAGLHGLVAVHDTTLGPALGGLRMWAYQGGEAEALTDVLRLSKGMTYKSAVAQTGLGGGKSVIIGDARTQKTPELFQAMGKLIDHLGGKYITAEDVGVGIPDLDEVAKSTRWVSGRRLEDGGSGNPSPYTARGTFVGIKASLEEVYGTDSIAGKTFSIQGVGAVAQPLCEWIVEEGGKLVACDVNEDNLEFARKLGAEIVDPDHIYAAQADVFVPCALGAILNDDTIPQLKVKAIAGCSNNQLLRPDHANVLKERGILYAPDYVINAGGIINVGCEFAEGGYSEATALPKVDHIRTALSEVYATAREDDITTAEAADRVAERRLKEGKEAKERQTA